MERQRDSGRNLANLPMMNLVSLAVPVALMCAQVLASHWWMAPAPAAPVRPQIVRPVIELTDAVTVIRGAEEILAGPGGRPRVPHVLGQPDLSTVSRLLGHVTDAYPDSRTAEVIVQHSADLTTVALVMDAVRGTDSPLFPEVVLTVRAE